jgi:hypothetical protein
MLGKASSPVVPFGPWRVAARRRPRARQRVWGLVAGLSCAAMIAAPGALAAVPFQDEGAAGGPLTHVAVGNELSCQVQHTGDTSLEFFPPSATPGDCGTFLAAGGTLYSPDFASHDSTATSGIGSHTPFSAVSQTAVTGAGSGADPFTIVTIVNVGSTGLQITEIDTYVSGQESYRTDVTVKNTGGAQQSVILYRAGDCYLQNTDSGFGFTEPASKSVGCSANANNSPAGRIEEWVPITAGNNFTEDGFSAAWGQIGAQTAFPDTCAHCSDMVDNGAGISWSFDVAPGAQVKRSHYTTFSPTGVAGPPPATTPPTTPPVTGPAGNPLGLPPNTHCVDRRKFSFKLHHARGHPVVEADIFINHKFIRAVTGPNIRRLTLRRLPLGRFLVRIVATQDSGAQLISQRKYRGCKKSRPTTRRGHR